MRFLFAFVAMIIAAPVALAGWPVADMNMQIDQTNFVVNSGCSGTLIDLKGRYILTANHCVEAQYETIDREKIADDGTITTEKVRRLKPGTVKQIVFDGAAEIRETTYRTKIVAVDKVRDLALVQILSDIPHTIKAKLSCGEIARGEAVFIVGNPTGVLYSSVVTGIVSSVQRTYETIRYGDGGSQQQPLMQVSAGVIGGNSGGAVYDGNGRLIGVPVIASKMNEILAFAVPLSAIKEFLTGNKLASVFDYCTAGK